jgi:cupin 2 domain-containing protein
MQGKIIKKSFYGVFDLKGKTEISESILYRKSFSLEKIVSKGYRTPEKEWLKSKKEEWVILLKGKAGIMFENGVKLELKEGDFVSIPGNAKHKVTYTSKRPECIWLALYYKNK